MVMVIMSIIGLVSSYALVESMKVYALVAPSLDAAYQSRLADERLSRDIRDLSATSSVSSMTASGLTFDDTSGNTIAYVYSDSELRRNGDLLAQGVTSFSFAYRKTDGTTANTAADLHLVEIDFTVRVSDQDRRRQSVVFPRALGS